MMMIASSSSAVKAKTPALGIGEFGYGLGLAHYYCHMLGMRGARWA